MSMGMATARSQLCLKRLLDEPPENLPKCKLPRLAPNLSTTGLSSCLMPRSPAPKSNRSQSPSRVGPYFLLERCEGEETYRAEHAHTKQQYTCQVELQILQKHTTDAADNTAENITNMSQNIPDPEKNTYPEKTNVENTTYCIQLLILLVILLILLKNTDDTAKIHAHKHCSF